MPPIPPEILKQVKGIAIRMHAREEAELRLHKKGPGPVTAGDIQLADRCLKAGAYDLRVEASSAFTLQHQYPQGLTATAHHYASLVGLQHLSGLP